MVSEQEVVDILSFVRQLPLPQRTAPPYWRELTEDASSLMADAARRGDWTGFVRHSPTRYRFNVCEQLMATDISYGALREAVAEAWQEAIRPDETLPIERIVRIFRSLGYFSDDGLPPPTQPVRLYRGANQARARGLAWSRDIGTAACFASYFAEEGEEGYVYTCMAPPDSLLGHLARAGEDEYIVDPASLAISPVDTQAAGGSEAHS